MSKRLAWVVSPYHNSDYDMWLTWADEPDKNKAAHRALDYAKARLEQYWDDAEGLSPEETSIKVTMTLEYFDEDDVDIPDEN